MNPDETFTFLDVAFVAVLPASGESPAWQPKLEVTDRALNGTDRMERSIRSRTWMLELELWIEPRATAAAEFATLLAAYAQATVGDLTFPGETPAAPVAAMLTACEVRPQRGGVDGYRGKATFTAPGGLV
ncbi:MAG: hypothetical protein EI684_05100 [Candidatus Viridilinea halotolerans]|uniref:Uncharacterized protein n=1 Tax=Candidatus Viridilinea halotolerans TaxID=2491704 RepID=A0A426U5N7_9CHLR|nr:MAG: hypothetical protein EI684_05100 [Candidatus Viridilinea halotolerans]